MRSFKLNVIDMRGFAKEVLCLGGGYFCENAAVEILRASSSDALRMTLVMGRLVILRLAHPKDTRPRVAQRSQPSIVLAMRSMKAGGAPEREATRDKEGKGREAENGGGAPVQGDLRDAGHGGKDYKNRARGGNKQPVPDGA